MRALSFLSTVLFLFSMPSLTASQTASDTPSAAMVAAAANAFHEYDNGNTLETILASGENVPSSVVLEKTFDPALHASSSQSERSYPNEHIEGLVRRSSFVGFGVPIKHWTYPSSQNQFVFSIYLIKLTRVLVSSSQNPTADQYIYIARAGGRLTYKNHTIQGLDPNFKYFRVGEEYLFFGEELLPALYKVDSERSLLLSKSQVLESSTHANHTDLYARETRSSLASEILAAKEIVNRSNGEVSK